MTAVDWEAAQSTVLVNPRMPPQEQQRIEAMLQQFPQQDGHVWIATSGSTGVSKWTALSKKAILASAAAVNSHLNSTHSDVWINPLPHFHVGGLGIGARCYLSGSKTIDFHEKWDPKRFHQLACSAKATLTALVPTQLYDLVTCGLQAPASLRATVIGGGALQKSLFFQAVELGWKPLPSYGLTECASQVATAPLGFWTEDRESRDYALKVLSHLKVRINDEGFICIAGPSLLSGYVVDSPDGPYFVDPRQDGWLQTEDLGTINSNGLIVHGRNSNFVKIGGESVDLLRLEGILQGCRQAFCSDCDMALIAVPDDRLGHIIQLAIVEGCASAIKECFNAKVLPFERIRQVYMVPYIPRTPLFKLDRIKLMTLINQ